MPHSPSASASAPTSPSRRLSLVLLLVLLSSGIYRPALAAASPPTRIVVEPAANGPQLIRVSLPLPPGWCHENESLRVSAPSGAKPLLADVRPLAWHPAPAGTDRSIRRALITFPWTFASTQPLAFDLQPVPADSPRPTRSPGHAHFTLSEGTLNLEWPHRGPVRVELIAPPRTSHEPPRLETVETNASFHWVRWHLPDPEWPRIIELRADALGGVVVIAHLQQQRTNDPFAPALGWRALIDAPRVTAFSGSHLHTLDATPFRHDFTTGESGGALLSDADLRLDHPAAPGKRRGSLSLAWTAPGRLVYEYQRCTPADRVPMQSTAWQRAEIVIAPAGRAPLTPALNSPHRVTLPASWLANHDTRSPSPPLPDELRALLAYHRTAIVRSLAVGDDWGNVTGYSDDAPHGGTFGMNRLNHGTAIFEEAARSGDPRLLESALLWCDNFFDQSIWWGEPQRGGTRYNNIVAMQRKPPTPDYMWRSDSSVNFCTKGYDAFQLAWEETGDPRMREALEAQTSYAAEHLHADRGECRNIGDVRDFIRLHRLTGQSRDLAEALRLFRELRGKLSPGGLFDQGGKALTPDPPFIDDDQRGLTVGYAKPYIIGYALAGLPELLAYAPNEPRLRETVTAVADFLAASQDPVGGWRYPHPTSSGVILSQAMEHAWQLTQAARALGPKPEWLDAIEATLRQRLHGWRRTGRILSGLEGWEISTGKVRTRLELQELYAHPADRDARRDDREGKISLGSAPPEGLVYFGEVLEFYLQHRPASRLLAEPAPDSPLGRVLARLPPSRP